MNVDDSSDPRQTPPVVVVRYAGRSMWPLFQEGDLLIVASVAPAAIEAGDCLVFVRQSGHQAVHRVIQTAPRLVTKGDAHRRPDDEPVDPARVVGRVVERIRSGRATPVRGGTAGSLTALFFGVAGRLDPLSAGRGGRVARTIRRLLTPMGAGLLRRAHREATDDGVAVTTRGGRVVAWRLGGEWTTPWPWSLVVDPASLDAPR